MKRVMLLVALMIPALALGDVVTISGATDSDDAMLGGYTGATSNFGAATSLYVQSRDNHGAKYDRVVMRFDETVYTEGASAIDACTLWLYVAANTVSGSGTNIIAGYPIAAANNWPEGANSANCPTAAAGVTYGKASCYDGGSLCDCDISSTNWAGSAGCNTPTTDYLPNADTVSVNWTGTSTGWKAIDVTAMVTAWVAGTYDNQGILLQNNYAASADNEAILTIRTSEYADYEPRLEITWSTPTEQASSRRRKMMGMGQ